MREIPEGYTFRAYHKRIPADDGTDAQKGGETVVEIGKVVRSIEPEAEPIWNVVATGASRCSRKDQYDKKRGREIAMGRALYAFENGLDFKGWEESRA